MNLSGIILGAPEWVAGACAIGAVALVVIAVAYGRAATSNGIKVTAGVLKALGLAALVVCLVEPLLSSVRPRPGSNLFLVVADNSRSLRVRDPVSGEDSSQLVAKELAGTSSWQTRLEQDFDVRRYLFDTRLKGTASFEELNSEGTGSALGLALGSLAERFRDRPLAGVLLFTDGNSTDNVEEGLDLEALPPVYPVLIGSTGEVRDLSVDRLVVSQTQFEATPVTLRCEVVAQGCRGEEIAVQLLDGDDLVVSEQTKRIEQDEERLDFRFQVKPEGTGVHFYLVRARLISDAPETTLENNERLATVDRGQGPFRVLYVTGRPNWEFKYMRRAVQEDGEVQLVGLIRIAKREPKFQFMGRGVGTRNQLYKGFENEDDEEAEQYDKPVLLRLGTENAEELREGFPKAAEDLFAYSALILDDVEAEFFDRDQMSLIQDFVSLRGGGLLMLGGPDSFQEGQYEDTPLENLLPVYLESLPPVDAESGVALELTRDGWLQPWVRVRSTEEEERRTLEAMPGFHALSRVGAAKPGAITLLNARDAQGNLHPALVTQRYGKGRSAALTVGDLWRWHLGREEGADSDLSRVWRQTVRWLVADVPGHVEVVAQKQESQDAAVITVQVKDPDFLPLDNARVAVTIERPDGTVASLGGQALEEQPGTYSVNFHSRLAGSYRANVVVEAVDGSEVGRGEAGWVAQPAADEFRRIRPNTELLEMLARETGGETLALSGIGALVEDLPNRRIPLTEHWTWPLWHQWWMFAFAIACLCAEWGLRRWRGLP